MLTTIGMQKSRMEAVNYYQMVNSTSSAVVNTIGQNHSPGHCCMFGFRVSTEII